MSNLNTPIAMAVNKRSESQTDGRTDVLQIA